jgi:hypothetical protein
MPKIAENYGNANVFKRPTNRKHFPRHGQFGLAASDYMYGNQRPEFSQCISVGAGMSVAGDRRIYTRVFTKFCILETSYISYIFFGFRILYTKVATTSRN